jgi:ketosteroid isomerase-like protein
MIYPSRHVVFGSLPLLLVVVGAAECAVAQPLTKSMVEAHIREWIDAFASNSPAQVVKLDPPANGFGYRALEARSASMSVATWLNTNKEFFGGMDYYRVRLDKVQTEVEGDIGLAWGFFTEDFKRKGRSPEKVRVRFTTTLRYDRGNWKTLLYHRDIQGFDEKGSYVPIAGQALPSK